ncbi:MAG: hypothetical protein WAW07_10205, partial [Bacteroidales bacterium]
GRHVFHSNFNKGALCHMPHPIEKNLFIYYSAGAYEIYADMQLPSSHSAIYAGHARMPETERVPEEHAGKGVDTVRGINRSHFGLLPPWKVGKGVEIIALINFIHHC